MANNFQTANFVDIKYFNTLKPCLDDAEKEGHNFIFAEDIYVEYTKKPSKRYGHLRTQTGFYDMTKNINPDGKAYYEIIRGDRPHKIFADIEWDDVSWKSVQAVKDWFLKLMEEEGLDKKKFFFTNASYGKKGSLHAVGNYNFENIDYQKRFWSKIKNKVMEDDDWTYTKETESNIIKCSPIDFVVYRKNQQMRLVNNSKMDKNGELKRPFLPLNREELNEDTFDNYVISLFDEDFKLIKVQKPETEEKYTAGKKETMFNKNLLIETFEKYDCKFVGIKGNLIELRNGSRNRKCPIGGEDNFSDNAYGFIKKDGIYYGCHDEKCKGKSICIFSRQSNRGDGKGGFDTEIYDEIPFSRWKNEILNAVSDDLNKVLNEVVLDMNNYFVKITGDAKPYYLYREIDSENVINWRMRQKTCLKEGFENMYFYIGKKKKYFIDLWLESPYIRTYQTIDAMPLEMKTEGKVFNVFSGLKMDKEKAFIEGKIDEGKYVGDFILNHWCNGDEKLYDWVIGYLAHQVQKPFEKVRKTLVLKSVEGAGKGCIINKIGKIIGSQWYFQPSSPDEIFGDFNHKIRNKSFIFIDEMFYGGNKKEDGLLKKLITEPNLTTNEKYMVQITTTNRTNFIIASNIDWIIPVGPQARRYVVLELSDGMTRMSEDEKKKIWGCSEASLAKFLHNIDLTDWNPDEEILTKALLEQKERNLNPPISWMLSSLQDETFPCEEEMPKDDFFLKFKNEYGCQRTNKIAFWRDIKKIFEPEIFQRREGTKRTRYIRLPSNEDLRECLSRYLKQEI